MIGALLSAVLALVRGPISEILGRLVTDRDLKARLEAEIEGKLIDHASAIGALQRDVLVTELQGSRLQRWWRPLLMYLIMLILSVYGLVLPAVECVTGHRVPFEPHWGAIPDGLWTLLTLGLGGYIGGRTLEKIALTRIVTKGTADGTSDGRRGNRMTNR
ncbi:MAG: 3TM-type holin [Hyphomicrobiales bacterium]